MVQLVFFKDMLMHFSSLVDNVTYPKSKRVIKRNCSNFILKSLMDFSKQSKGNEKCSEVKFNKLNKINFLLARRLIFLNFNHNQSVTLKYSLPSKYKTGHKFCMSLSLDIKDTYALLLKLSTGHPFVHFDTYNVK